MTHNRHPRLAAKLCILLLLCLCLLCSCENLDKITGLSPEPEAAAPRYLRVVDDEPDTVDFQCTTLHYTVAVNVFNRLVETETDAAGNTKIVPSLAESWTVSESPKVKKNLTAMTSSRPAILPAGSLRKKPRSILNTPKSSPGPLLTTSWMI